MRFIWTFIVAVIALWPKSYAQETFTLTWQEPVTTGEIVMPWFDGASSNVQNQRLPSYCSSVYAEKPVSLRLENVQFVELSVAEANANGFSELTEDLQFEFHQNGALVDFCVLPFRRNRVTGKIEKLINFSVKTELTSTSQQSLQFKTSAADTSILATGTWYRVGVSTTGVYKLTPQFLADCGLGSNIPSAAIRVFGNGNGMLSERNDDNPNPQLKEVAIYVNDGGDGVFSGNDYALFYAKGPHLWRYDENTNRYRHTYNLYSDQSSYFINVDVAIGKRVGPAGYAPTFSTYSSNSFDDFAFFEDDRVNLVGTGRQWFGDLFDFKSTHDYTFQFDNVQQQDTAYLTTRAVARSIVPNTSMSFRVNSNLVSTLVYDTGVGTGSGSPFAIAKSSRDMFMATSNSFAVQATYNKSVNPSATAWMDYVALEVRCNLVMNGSGIEFRDKRAYRNGGITEFNVNNVNGSLMVWDVTDHQSPRSVQKTVNGTQAQFLAPADSLRTFVAIQGSGFPLPAKIEAIDNQNLAALTNVDMIIVAHPQFLAPANDLAQFHRNHDGMIVRVVTPQQIYNEFSSGMQDITGIKLFFRHVYQKVGNPQLSHVLFFGDASYDYKNRSANMHNFVPIYQSNSSFSLYSSFCTDDFFGYLDDGEGRNMLLEDIDLAIGRFPVTTFLQAQTAVQKVITYSTDIACHGDWRNRAMFIADDADEPGGWEMDFVERMDALADEIDTVIGDLNLEKVYIDSYVQEVKAGSQRYPEARSDIFRKVQRGNLVSTYLGHGGEVGWAKERILQLADVNGWDNMLNMPVFTTVTCEFARLDDPTRVSAGEQLFLNATGGAAALFSTLRPVFATSATYRINNQLFEFLFANNNGEYLTLGQVNQATKNANNSGDRVRFALLGDPAMKLAIPKYRVVTDSINGVEIASFADTLKALSKVKVHGHIEDVNGVVISNYNGVVNPTVYDKKAPKSTLMNDGYGYIFDYKSRENIIYRGQASVEEGRFAYEFVIPLDINFTVGDGKFSYYATDSITDASGNEDGILVGGLDLNAKPDDEGPLVRVFINDTNFISGGLTDANPTNISLITDSSGINTVGSGIGHDIIGILDGQTNTPFILNEYFQSDLNSYQSGTVTYPFFSLAPGEHHLLVRAWDVNNNMGQGETYFIVDDSHGLALNRVLNYPNPFSEITRFQFEHNRAGEPLEVDIQIFDQVGNLVHRIIEQVESQGNRVNEITWDGTNATGSPLGNGVFVYYVIVRSTEDGTESTGYSKLVYVK